MDPDDWPLKIICDNQSDYKPLTFPVMSTLKKIASHMEVVRDNGVYIRKTSTFDDLSNFAFKMKHKYDELTNQSMSLLKTHSFKLPDFRVSRFDESDNDGQEYLKALMQAFTSNALSRFLTDDHSCEQHLEWSSALAARVRVALNESPFLAFIAAEHEKEQSCYQLYHALESHLSKGDLLMARTFAEWQKLFGLQCDTIDDFPSYYSSVRKGVTRLREYDSVAIKDDTFIRAYLCKSLDVKELRSSTKEFMANMDDDSLDILEKIHKDYSGIMATSSLRESDLSTVRSSRRTEVHTKEERKSSAVKFPPNTGNKLPNHVYSQVKQWFELMTAPASQRKPGFLDGFTYTHKKPEVKVVYRDKPNKQQLQRRSKDRSSTGSKGSTGRNARRRKRKPRESDERSRSRSQDRDRDERHNPAVKSSSARRGRRRLRSRISDDSRRSNDSSSVSTSDELGMRYSDGFEGTDNEEDMRKHQKLMKSLYAPKHKTRSGLSPFES